jgi:hypothetical protein
LFYGDVVEGVMKIPAEDRKQVSQVALGLLFRGVRPEEESYVLAGLGSVTV